MKPNSPEDLENRFTYHSPRPGQPERYAAIRTAAKDLATLIVDSTPASREQAVALTRLETAVFWANAAIARNEPGEPDRLLPHQRRVVDEAQEIKDRLDRLGTFINGLDLEKLTEQERGLLIEQESLMNRLHHILRERITTF